MATITLQSTGIDATVAQIGGRLDEATMLQAAGRGISNLVIRHLRRRNSRPSRPGWPKSNYWERAAGSTQTSIARGEALVAIHAPGIRLRLKGGRVVPRRGKALAIPARPEVAGVWPSEHSAGGRVFLLVRKALGKAYLVEQQADGHLRILWRLVRSTTHTADSTVLPTRDEIGAAAIAAIRSILPKTK